MGWPAGLVMGIKMRPLVLCLSSGQTWPENPVHLFAGFDGGHNDGDDHGDLDDDQYHDDDDGHNDHDDCS